jgi:50S ribosomal protein L16 3-hydroxylase
LLENQDGVGILPNFTATETFELEPGDALYIPPQYAHWGTSIGASQCYSIGFRTPAVADMLEGFSDSLIAASTGDERYVDPQPGLPAHPARLEWASIAQTYTELQTRLANPLLFRRWFGCYSTQPKYPELRDRAEPSWDSAGLRRALAAGQRLQHHVGSRFAYLCEDGSLLLFVDGEAFDLPPSCETTVATLSMATTVTALEDASLSHEQVLRECVLLLLNQGSLILA